MEEPRPRPPRDEAKASRADERRLCRRAAEGDRAAQQELLLAHVGRIRRRVACLVGGGADRDDLVQQSCIELLHSLARYRGDASLELWCDRITTHVVFKHFRTQSRRHRRVTVVEDVDGASPLDTARMLEARRAMADARAILERLKPERRIVFLLVAVEGRTLAETAALLDLGLAAAKSRYLRARRDVDRAIRSKPSLAALLGREPDDD